MRRAGRLRARIARLVRGTAVWGSAGFIWAVVFAEPATSPPAWSATAAGDAPVYAELASAVAERLQRPQAASRSEPAVPPPPPVVWPARGQLTGWYGERRGAARHPGVDIDGATGDPVTAAAAGRVVHAGPSPAGYSGYGTVVIVDHGELTSIYAHLSKVTVRAGQDVVTGQSIGAIGTTGSVTGSHLHFEVRRGAAAVDPKGWLPRR
jgi:murein DD-endopeptidase MepM/ murein hydrolase activator NlpD